MVDVPVRSVKKSPRLIKPLAMGEAHTPACSLRSHIFYILAKMSVDGREHLHPVNYPVFVLCEWFPNPKVNKTEMGPLNMVCRLRNLSSIRYLPTTRRNTDEREKISLPVSWFKKFDHGNWVTDEFASRRPVQKHVPKDERLPQRWILSKL